MKPSVPAPRRDRRSGASTEVGWIHCIFWWFRSLLLTHRAQMQSGNWGVLSSLPDRHERPQADQMPVGHLVLLISKESPAGSAR